jgi:hypothetical protein
VEPVARRLRKAEAEVVDAVVADGLTKIRPQLVDIERVLVEEVLGKVPEELRGETVKRVMDGLGEQLYYPLELAAMLGPDGSEG